MSVSVVQAQVPSEIQSAADKVLRAAGLTAGDVIRKIMTLIADEKCVPLDLFQPNAETLAAFREVEQGRLQSFDTLDELYASLNAED